jgi:hypothetical protein
MKNAKFQSEILSGRDHFEELIYGWEYYIEIYLTLMRYEDANWIHLAQDRDQWRVLVNTAMNFRVP